MNEEALQELYVLAKGDGYSQSYEEFKSLMSSNQEAIGNMYSLARSEGYQKPIEEFKTLVGFEDSVKPVDVSVSAINPDAGVPEAVPEKKNPFETDPELPQEVPNELFPQPQTEGDGELPSGYSQGDTSSESYLTGGSFDATDPFATTVLADDYDKDLGENVFNANVNAIVPETTSAREEGEVVGEMNYKFNQYGFEFEETGFGDNMIVKSANDQEIRIPLDAALGAGAGSRAEELRQFLIKNKEASVEAFNRASKNEQKYLNKIQNKEQLVKLNTLFNTQVDRFSDDVRNYSAEKLRLSRLYKESFANKNADELLNNPLYQEYREATKVLDSARTSLINKQKSFVTKGAQLDEMVGEYTLMRNTSGESSLAIERLGYSFLEGTGGAFFGELADGALSLAGKFTNFDASRDRFAADEHVDYAVAQLTNNIEGFNFDETGVTIGVLQAQLDLDSDEYDVLRGIKTLLAKKELDVIDQKKLKGLLSEFNPKDLQVILENIENEDGDDMHSVTESIYEDVSTKGLGEYERTEILLSGDGIEAPEGVMYPVNVDAYEKAKSAAMGGAFSRNRYTGLASNLDLEEGTRDMFRTSVNKYLAGETDGQSAYRKAIKNSGNDIQKAFHGVAYSIPAFITIVKSGPKKALQLTEKYGPQLGKKLLKNRKFNNKASRIIRLMGQSHEAQMNKMANNPNFDNIDLDEQRAVAIPVSIVTAVLEDIGFRNIINSKGLINSLAARAISKFAKVRAVNPNAGTRTFAQFVRQDLNNLMGKGAGRTLTKGGLTVLAGGAAEFETGALQSIGEQLAESVYNTYKREMDGIEGEMFDTADSVGEFFTEVMYQGYLEMLGGKIMAVPTAISVMGNNPADLNMVTDEAFEMFQGMLQDPQYKNMFTTNLKQRVADKTDALTQKDADAMMETFNKIEGLMPQVAGDMTVQQQRVALSLVMERQALKSEIAPLAPELAIKQNERIKEITEQLEDITLIANAEQEAAMEAEQSIPDINSKSKTKTDPAVEADPDISLEEQEDIEERFGEESATSPEEQVEENLFFNKRGKSKKKLTKDQRSMRNKVINKAVNAAQSLAKNVKTKIVMHESTKEFNKATQRNGRGFYDFDTNTIHLDMNKANEITVAHEAFHAVLFQKLGEANVAAAVQTMTSAIMKASPKNSMLFKRANVFAAQYAEQGATVQNEERLAELFGLMASRYETLNAPEQNAIITFLKTTATKLGLDKFINIGEIVTEDDTQVVELLNALADKVATGQEIFTNDLKILKKSSPYSETGVPVAINPDAKPIRPRGRETRVYTEDRVGNYNEMTLNEFVMLHDGNVYVITSDASKLGRVEETGQILDGGFGYSLLAANMESGVGFASLDETTAAKNMNKLKKAYKTGDRVGVLIMIQTPDAMYGNMYGGEYFFDAITKMQKKNPEAYAEYSKNLSNYVVKKMKGKLKKATRDAIIDPNSVTKKEFKELMDKESFDRRRNFITGVIPARNGMRMDKNAPWKKAFSDININTQEFTLRYGDQALLGKKFLKENKGGFLVGGFTYVVPKNTKKLVEGIQDKGFTHPFFQGKVPAEPNTAVMLDGLYDINTTLQQYMPETLMVQESQKEETSRRVREQYPDDRFYLKKGFKLQTKKQLQAKVDNELATENEQKALDELLEQEDSNDTTEVEVYIELKDRTYTNLTGANKTKFKENPINEDILVLGRANAGSLVAQSKPPLFENVTEEITEKPRGREQQEQEIFDYVTAAREDNFRDEVTKDFLVRIKKYPIKLVNRMMEVDVDLFKTLPKTFGSLTGGFNSGLRLYKRTKAFEQKLIKANKRKKVKLTEQQIADQTIEFLKKQPEYLKEGDGNYLTTKQAMLQVEFQRSVGTRTSESVQEKLTEARKQVQERKRGAKSLQKAKAAVRNFIRKSLPSDIYTRSEVMSLVRKVTNATEANIENIFDEVLEFVNVKNNTRLEKKIKDILNGKYETTVAGRKKGSKISLEMKERIEGIAKDRLAPTATAEEVEAENQRLTEEFNAIDGKKNLTEGDYSRAVDIQILINLNNSLLMENNDVNKTGSLDVAATILEEMIAEGKSELRQQLEDAHKKYNDDASVAYEEVTGQKVDLNDKGEQEGVDLSNQKLLNKKRNKTKSVIKKFLNTLSTNVTKFFNETEALDGLMDLVSKLPGEMFGGRLQTMVTGRVDSSSRMYKQRMMQQEEIVAKKLEELFGKKWRNKVRALNKQEVAYVLDPNEVAQAQEAFDNDPSLKNKLNLKEVLLKNETKMSQNEMLYYYNLYKDPANRGSFEATFGKDYARIMEEIESKIDNSLKEFGDWQVNEFYPSLYSHYNETYKALYRTNMPWNRYYSGMIYRNDTQGNPVEQEPLDLLSQKSIMNTSVGTASTKARVQNNLPIRKMNSMNVMSTYLRDMEYFAAYGETIRDIHKMFNNKNVRTAIEAVHGEYVNRLINNMIGKIANNGVRNNPADRFINQMQNAFIFSRIGLNPTVMIKQLTSMITYANDIGVRNWLKYTIKTIPQMKSVFKEMSKNSVYMQDRNRQSITRVIESYSKEGMVEMVPNQYWDNYVNFIMYTTKFGDKAAIYLGGAPNYLYYKAQAKKRGLTEEQAQQEAIIKFEKDTKRTQQSMDLQDKDFYQTSGAIQRGLNMFLTTPKQYLRKEIQSTRNLYRKLKAWDRNAGKGTLGQNLRTFITYHFVAPALFQYVALGLPGLLRGKRDDDEEDMLRAMLIGNLNALFIVGEVISGTADLVQGKPYAGESVRSLAPLMQLQRLTKLAKRAMDTKDPKKKKDALEKLYVELAATPGLPAIQIHRFIKNLDKLGEGDDAGKDLLRLLNFSDYVISGPKNKKSSSTGPSVQEQNAKYYKEQERKKKQAETLSRRERPTSNRRARPTRRRRTN